MISPLLTPMLLLLLFGRLAAVLAQPDEGQSQLPAPLEEALAAYPDCAVSPHPSHHMHHYMDVFVSLSLDVADCTDFVEMKRFPVSPPPLSANYARSQTKTASATMSPSRTT